MAEISPSSELLQQFIFSNPVTAQTQVGPAAMQQEVCHFLLYDLCLYFEIIVETYSLTLLR